MQHLHAAYGVRCSALLALQQHGESGHVFSFFEPKVDSVHQLDLSRLDADDLKCIADIADFFTLFCIPNLALRQFPFAVGRYDLVSVNNDLWASRQRAVVHQIAHRRGCTFLAFTHLPGDPCSRPVVRLGLPDHHVIREFAGVKHTHRNFDDAIIDHRDHCWIHLLSVMACTTSSFHVFFRDLEMTIPNLE